MEFCPSLYERGSYDIPLIFHVHILATFYSSSVCPFVVLCNCPRFNPAVNYILFLKKMRRRNQDHEVNFSPRLQSFSLVCCCPTSCGCWFSVFILASGIPHVFFKVHIDPFKWLKSAFCFVRTYAHLTLFFGDGNGRSCHVFWAAVLELLGRLHWRCSSVNVCLQTWVVTCFGDFWRSSPQLH